MTYLSCDHCTDNNNNKNREQWFRLSDNYSLCKFKLVIFVSSLGSCPGKFERLKDPELSNVWVTSMSGGTYLVLKVIIDNLLPCLL